MNELNFNEQQLIVQPGSIQFNDFERLKQEAEKLADQIKTVEVTDENVKHSKKLLAEVNKRVQVIDAQRIAVKKTMLQPYQLFEEQVKEIVSIVKDAEDFVRVQVKSMEELERVEKEHHLEQLFHKRIIHYSFRDLFHFKDFLKPKHLNKTTSIEAVEKEMVDFLEKITMDLKAIEAMDHSHDVLAAYVESKDLGTALWVVQQQQQRKQAVVDSEAIKHPTEDKIGWLVHVKVYNQKELKLLEFVLKENGFEHETDKITL